LPADEEDRLAALARYDIMDPAPDPRADVFTRLASDLLDTPISVISLVGRNRQWFKASIGLDLTETPRCLSFCAHAILAPTRVTVVGDATLDPRFGDNPMVTGAPWIRFYAGAPTLTPEGYPIGALSILDTRPRSMDTRNRRRLADLSVGAASVLELHRNAAQLRQAASRYRGANRAKSGFLAAMSHEIRTPMNAVLGLAASLLDGQLRPEQHQAVQAIHDAGDTLLQVLNDILDLSKLEAGRMTFEAAPFSPGQLTHGVVSLMGPQAVTKGLAMDAECDPAVPDGLVGDAGRIRQILLNLASNAVKFTAAGSVTVRCACLERTAARATIQWTVTDTGIGIPPRIIGKLFHEFVQADDSIARRFGGSGMGLAISRRLASLMGGRIMVESTPNQGSVFTVELTLKISRQPLDAARHRVDPAPAFNALLRSRGRRLRVLFAEDNPANQLVARRLLTGFDVQVDAVGDGLEAVAAARRFDYDIIFMDMRMPKMDGLKATRAIRGLGGRMARVPIVALTANAFADDVKACLDAGMNRFLSKPVGKDMLLSAAVAALSGSPGATTAAAGGDGHEDCDISALAELCDAIGTGALDEMLAVFESDTRERLRKMTVHLHDPDILRLEVHSLRGAADVAGAPRLARLADRLEHRLRARESVSAADISALAHAFDAYLTSRSASPWRD
jgi:signal transduction histidine kinase/HPt (histidine-containing phosphotransfer) domain-containing protein/ActR/RegA family two-component response regulator